MSFIEGASKQTGLTIVQVKVGGVALSHDAHLTYCLYRDGKLQKEPRTTANCPSLQKVKDYTVASVLERVWKK